MRITKNNKIKRKRSYGFRKRMSTRYGRAVINRRRSNGRRQLSA